MKWDAKILAELKQREATCLKAVEETQKRLQDMEATDGSFPDAKMAEHTVLSNKFMREQAQLNAAKADVGRMELLEPKAAAESLVSPLGRFIAAGPSGLGREEQELYLGEITGSEAVKAGIPKGGGLTFKIRSQEDKSLTFAQLRSMTPDQIQAAVASDAASGQKTVDDYLRPDVISRLKAFGGAKRWCQTISTMQGNDYRILNADNTAKKGARVGSQNTALGAVDDVADFDDVTLKAYTYQSKPIRFTREMIADSVVNVVAFGEDECVRRLGRIENEEATDLVGAATNPTGILQSAAVGKTTASNTEIDWEELVDMIFSVDGGYVMGEEPGMGGYMSSSFGNGIRGFMISWTALQLFMKMHDGDDRPVWNVSTRVGEPNTIFGWPYVLNFDLPAVAASATPVVFGDGNGYSCRDVGEVEIFNFLDSRTIQNNAVEILALHRFDARPTGPFSAADVADSYKKLQLKA